MCENRLQWVKGYPVFLTHDIPTRLLNGGLNEEWLGHFLVLDLGHARRTFGFEYEKSLT